MKPILRYNKCSRTMVLALGIVMLAGISGRTEAMAKSPVTETITLGGGCFWCMEAMFEELQGVHKVASGYAGGNPQSASYKEVCDGDTGHAEVIQITFDPEITPVEDILFVFFTMHDPTTKDRQGADVGSQYRSVVFYGAESQKTATEAMIASLTVEKVYPAPIVTEIAPLDRFFKAEEYHQDYYNQNKTQGYCMAVINPKMKKFRQKFADKLK